VEIKLDEVEYFGLVSTAVGVIVFIVVCSWDSLVGITVNHHNGYGWMQILIIASSGLYSMWALAINRKWSEYRKKIHSLEEKNASTSKR